MTLEYLSLILTMSGFPILGATNGVNGKKTVLSASVQIVLLDRRLPDPDGLVLCRELRDLLGTDIPIIMMTADAEVGLLAATEAAGATQLLCKPCMPQALFEMLREALPA